MPSLLLKFKKLIITSSCCNSGSNDGIEVVIKESSARSTSVNSTSDLKSNIISPSKT